MRRDAWGMSARLAWHRPRVRALTIALLVFATAVNTLFLLKVVPAVRETTTAVVHYNIYLGIDDVRSWEWVFLWPAVWEGAVLAALAAALGAYQKDTLLAYGILGWSVAWSLPWAIGLFYLMSLNVR